VNTWRGGSEINDLFNEIFESEYYSSFENDNERVAFHTDVKHFFILILNHGPFEFQQGPIKSKTKVITVP
jgi:hypothetical protein